MATGSEPMNIVLVGDLTRESLAVAVARRIAAAGHVAEVVGRVGDDERGEALLLDLSREGIGHVAVLRVTAGATPSHITGMPLDAADLALALGYLRRIDAVLLVDPLDEATTAEAAAAAAYHGAHLVIAVATPATGATAVAQFHDAATPLRTVVRDASAGAPALVAPYVAADSVTIAAAAETIAALLLTSGAA